MADYWALRNAKAQQRLTDKNIKDTEKQLKTYYLDAMQGAIRDFEDTYLHILERAEDGKSTPADMYKLSKYWSTVAQLDVTLRNLGDKQSKVLADNFVKQWKDIYEAMAIPGETAFRTANLEMAKQMVNGVWCADGKSWSQRIWGNTEALKQTLNETMIECVVNGRKPSELKKRLMADFGVSFRRADMLVRTEMQHIQTISAKQRYTDSGITKVEFLGREEKHGCSHSPSCHDLDGTIIDVADIKEGVNAPPLHPRCRCSLVPVIE